MPIKPKTIEALRVLDSRKTGAPPPPTLSLRSRLLRCLLAHWQAPTPTRCKEAVSAYPLKPQLLLESSIMKQDIIVVLKKFPVLLLVPSQESYTSTLDLKWVNAKKPMAVFLFHVMLLPLCIVIDMSRKVTWQQAQLCNWYSTIQLSVQRIPFGS